jgi:hypothetical protein
MLDLPFSSALRLASMIRIKMIGCLELLDLYLERTERFNLSCIRFARLLEREYRGFATPPGFGDDRSTVREGRR